MLCFSGGSAIYTNWIPGHSNNFGGHNSEDCVALIPYMGGVWDDIPCGGNFSGIEFGEKHLSFCEYSKHTYEYVYAFAIRKYMHETTIWLNRPAFNTLTLLMCFIRFIFQYNWHVCSLNSMV